MDIEKAISLIILELKCRPHNIDPDWYDSQVLAIEALEFCQHFNPDQVPVIDPHLASQLKALAPIHNFPPAPNIQPGAPVEHTRKPKPKLNAQGD